MIEDLLIDADPPCYQSARELAVLYALVALRRPARVLEVGSFHGGTLERWIAAAAPGGHVVSMDLPVIRQPVNRWQAWADAVDVRLTVLTGSSHDPRIIRQAADCGPYDFILIDADHTEWAVRADWATYRPMVAQGGLIALHDINERPGYGVSALWAELRAAERAVEINAGLPGLCGIGVVFA